MIHSLDNITDWVSVYQPSLKDRLTLLYIFIVLRVPEQDAKGNICV
jgi:hypothetical protein